MSKRIKSPVAQPLTRVEVESLVNDIANAMNNRRRIVAEADKAKLEIDESIAGSLILIDEAVKIKTAKCQAWAEANDAEFGKLKSIKFPSGIIGFRTGTPKLKLLNRSWTWEKVLEAVQLWLPNFIRSKPEVDKEAIIAQANDLAEFLPKCGVKVAQDEGFYIEPNLSVFETRAKEAA